MLHSLKSDSPHVTVYWFIKTAVPWFDDLYKHCLSDLEPKETLAQFPGAKAEYTEKLEFLQV